MRSRVEFEPRLQTRVREAAGALEPAGSEKRPRLAAASTRANAAPPSTVLPADEVIPFEAFRRRILYRAGDVVGCMRCGSFSERAHRSQLYNVCEGPKAFEGNPQRKWRRDNSASGRHPKEGRKHPIPTPRRMLVSDPAVQWLGLTS